MEIFSFLREPFDQIAIDAGLPVDLVRYPVALIAAQLFGFLYRVLPKSPAVRHLYSILVSCFLFTFAINFEQLIHSFLSSLVVYLSVFLLPSHVVPTFALVFCLGYMSASHIYRMYTDWLGWSMDFTGPQMILTLKLISFAYCWGDGHLPKEKQEALRPYPKAHVITAAPSPLAFFGWVYWFAGFLAGPSLEFTEYDDFVRHSCGSRALRKDERETPSPLGRYFVVWLQTAANGLLMFAGMQIFSPDLLRAHGVFGALPYYERVWRLYVHMTLVRFKYYFAWSLAENAGVSSGFAWHPEERHWLRSAGAFPVDVELSTNMQGITNNWNLGTARFLKYYIYTRWGLVKGRPGSMSILATFVVSALWHGFYPGYYMFFVSAALMTVVEKSFQAVLRPRVRVEDADGKQRPLQPLKFIYDVVGGMLTSWCMNACGASFYLLTWDDTLQLYGNLYYGGHVLIGLGILLALIIPKPKSKKPKAKTQ